MYMEHPPYCSPLLRGSQRLKLPSHGDWGHLWTDVTPALVLLPVDRAVLKGVEVLQRAVGRSAADLLGSVGPLEVGPLRGDALERILTRLVVVLGLGQVAGLSWRDGEVAHVARSTRELPLPLQYVRGAGLLDRVAFYAPKLPERLLVAGAQVHDAFRSDVLVLLVTLARADLVLLEGIHERRLPVKFRVRRDGGLLRLAASSLGSELT